MKSELPDWITTFLRSVKNAEESTGDSEQLVGSSNFDKDCAKSNLLDVDDRIESNLDKEFNAWIIESA